MQAHPALVLNAEFRPLSYFPLSLIPWQDAVSAIVSDKISIVAEYDIVARSPSTEIRLPSVVALRQYQPVPRRVAFTRFNVFLRDGFVCQYCTRKFPAVELMFDHVMPRCRGGRTSWENVVAACSPCNQAKDNFSAMKPANLPREPTPHERIMALAQILAKSN
jgi:5-methylcytosine-specific restriction endonuclease McrA